MNFSKKLETIKDRINKTNRQENLMKFWKTEPDREVRCCSVTRLCPTMQPHGLQYARLPWLTISPSLFKFMSTELMSRPTISSSVVPFSHLQSFPASGSFLMSQFFSSGGQSIGVSASASVLLMNIQDWFPLRWTGWISLQFKYC